MRRNKAIWTRYTREVTSHSREMRGLFWGGGATHKQPTVDFSLSTSSPRSTVQIAKQVPYYYRRFCLVDFNSNDQLRGTMHVARHIKNRTMSPTGHKSTHANLSESGVIFYGLSGCPMLQYHGILRLSHPWVVCQLPGPLSPPSSTQHPGPSKPTNQPGQPGSIAVRARTLSMLPHRMHSQSQPFRLPGIPGNREICMGPICEWRDKSYDF